MKRDRPQPPSTAVRNDAEGPSARPILVVISGPSGAGKTTVEKRLLADEPGVTRAVTCTTRVPRSGEKDGVDYHFLTPEEFARRVDAGEFLEHAEVHGRRYGTLKAEVVSRLHTGRDVLLNVDVQGAASIRARSGEDLELAGVLVTVFLIPPTRAVLEQRLRGRGTDGEEVIRARLATAREEIAQWRHFDYLLVSYGIDEDVRRLQVILAAERMRQSRVVPPPLMSGG